MKTPLPKNTYLHEEEILSRIDTLRHTLQPDPAIPIDETDVKRFNEWQARAVKALIFLSLQKHEGIKMIIDKANEEIAYRRNLLETKRPTDLSPNGCAMYTTECAFHYQAIDMWTWFKNLFSEAESDLKAVEYDLEAQEAEPEIDTSY